MSIFNNQIRYNIIFVLIVILFCSTQSIANESNSNKLSINSRLHDNTSLILSCPISIANANIDEITVDTPKPNPKKTSALEYFEDAAICAKKERNINAMFNFVSAIMWIGVGIADKGDEPRHYYTYNQHGSSMGTYPEFDDSPTARTAYGLAGMYTLIGIGYITSSSPTESEYNRIMDSYNFSQRQEIANKSLKYIVNIEKKRRLSGGVLSVALGAAFAMIQPIQTSEGKNSFLNQVLAALNIGVGFYNFASTSPTEKILKQYNRDIKPNNSLNVQIKSNYSDELQLVLLKSF